jgi:hypothetical protein
MYFFFFFLNSRSQRFYATTKVAAVNSSWRSRMAVAGITSAAVGLSFLNAQEVLQ